MAIDPVRRAEMDSDPVRIAALPLSVDDPSWADLPALVEGHGMAALIAGRLPPSVPAGVRVAVDDAAERTLLRGACLADDCRTVVAAFGAAGIPCAAVKWAWLAPRLYDPPASRPAADLDLVVPTLDAQAPAVAAVLGGLDYDLIQRTWKHLVFLKPAQRFVHDWRGEHPRNPRPVEVHGWLGESFRGVGLNLTSELHIASGLHIASVREASAIELPPSVAIVHVAAHATVDALGRKLRLLQLVDLARLSAVLGPDDWRRVEALAGTEHAARFVWPALTWAKRALGAAVPEALLTALSARVRPALKEWAASMDVDALSRFGRADVPRRFAEVPSIWPITAAERWRTWRFILWPDRWELADRYPVLADSPLWPMMYVHHAAYNLRLVVRRWKGRGAVNG